MYVIVTGGSGFIGSRLVRALCDQGHHVSVVDVSPLHAPDATVHLASVLDTEAMAEIIHDANAVIHLAGYVRDAFRQDPCNGTTLQVQGTLNVLEACRRNQVPHFLLASSFYVYHGVHDHGLQEGQEQGHGVNEEAALNPTQMELFGAAKLMSEALCREYTHRYGVKHTILRFGSAYGAGGSNVVRTFMQVGLRGQQLEVWGEGKRRNQYTFVNDLVNGIIAALASENETFNLTSPEVTTTACLAQTLHREFGFDLHFDLTRREEPSLPYVDSSKAARLLNWKPSPLIEGLRQTMQEIREGITHVAP